MDEKNQEKYDPERASRGWPADHTGERKLEHLLVVVDADTLAADDPRLTPLLARTATIASSLGCRVTIYAPCADTEFADALGATDSTAKQPQTALDLVATRLDELCLWLKSKDVQATPLALWESLEADTLLDRIRETAPDMVLKSATSQRFLVGLMTHTDWELLRQASVPVWYVEGSTDKSSIRHVLTALGTSDRPDQVTGPHDYDVCALANLIAARNSASNTILHTYQVPQHLPASAAYPPEATPLASLATVDPEQQTRVAEHHRKAMEAFADLFRIDQGNVIIRPGRLGDVIDEVADASRSDLIVMGARNLSRLQRFLRPVNAETVLSESPCDVLILPEQAAEQRAEPEPDTLEGASRLDLEAAMLNPEAAFGSPTALAEYDALTPALRLRLLKIWENDVRAEMREEEEGGPVGPSRADLLQQIHQARENLSVDGPAAGQPEFS